MKGYLLPALTLLSLALFAWLLAQVGHGALSPPPLQTPWVELTPGTGAPPLLP